MSTEAQLRREEIEEVATSAPVARRVIRKTGIDKALLSAGIVADPGTPPSAPQNVTAESAHTSLVISWDKPPGAEAVGRSVIELQHPDGTIRTYDGQATGDSVLDLAHVEYRVRVKLVSIFGRESEWSEPIYATPRPTAAYEIDLAEAAILDNLRGLLPNANLATIEDANKLGDGVVAGRTLLAWDLSAQNAVFQNVGMRSANIETLTVDKLTGGSLTANIITATGRIESGGFKMDSSGGQLLNTGSFVAFPDTASSSKLTNSGGTKWGSLQFFATDSAPFVRGAGINASGIQGTGRDGLIRLCSDNGNQNNDSINTAIITVQSSSDNSGGRIEMKEDVGVNRHFLVRGRLDLQGNFVPAGRYVPQGTVNTQQLTAGSSVTVTHDRGYVPLFRAFYTTGGAYRDVDSNGNIDCRYTTTSIVITNNTGGTITVYVEIRG